MNYKSSFLAATIAIGFLGACSNDNGNEGAKHSKYITVSTGIGQMTRVSTLDDSSQAFDEGDQISIYAWTGDAATIPAAADRVVNNSINTLTAGAWVPNPQMLWKNTSDAHYFLSIYPATTEPLNDLTAVDYTLDPTNEEKSDMLVATNLTGIKNTLAPVPLVFDHVMGRMVVSLTFRNQFGGIPAVQAVTVKNMATRATVNCLAKTVAAEAGNTIDLSLPRLTGTQQYASVAIPGSAPRTIVIGIDGKDYTYTHTSDIAIESGKLTTVSLIVGRDSVSLGSVSINTWQQGTEISGGEAL